MSSTLTNHYQEQSAAKASPLTARSLTLKDVGAAYSLATLWLIISWKELLYPGTNGYLLATPSPVLEHWAIFLNVLILTLVFIFLIWIASVISPWLRNVALLIFVLAALLAFAPLSSEFVKWYSPETRHLVSAPLPIAVITVSSIACFWSELKLARLADYIKTIAIFFLPFCLLIILKSAHSQLIREDPALSPSSVEDTAFTGTPALKKKVVWIILDELDYSALDVARKQGLDESEFDRLFKESFVADHAYAPNDNTLDSISSLVTGQMIRSAKPASSRDLILVSDDGDRSFNLRGSDNIFRELKSMGGRSAIVGWYHPYSRLFQDDVAYCYWKPLVNRSCANAYDFPECSRGMFLRAVNVIPFVGKLFPAPHRIGGMDIIPERMSEQLARREYLESKALALVSDPKLNLVFLHFSVSHFPYMSRHGGESEGSYFTALEVANDTLRLVRQGLEKSGEWNNTTLIVTSDHPWREKQTSPDAVKLVPKDVLKDFQYDARIPFIVKLAGQENHVDYHHTFNTVITRKLITDILVDKVDTTADLVEWFDRLDASQPEQERSAGENRAGR